MDTSLPCETHETGGHRHRLCSCGRWAKKSTQAEPCCGILEKNFGQMALTGDAKQSMSGENLKKQKISARSGRWTDHSSVLVLKREPASASRLISAVWDSWSHVVQSMCMHCYPFASTAASNSSPKRPDHPGVESWTEPAVHAEWMRLRAGHPGRVNLQQNWMSRPPGRQKHATHWRLKPKDSACHPQNRWSGRCHSEPAKAQWRESLPEEWEWDGCGKKEADWVTEPTRTDLLGIVPLPNPAMLVHVNTQLMLQRLWEDPLDGAVRPV